jgi:hypothetical protein
MIEAVDIPSKYKAIDEIIQTIKDAIHLFPLQFIEMMYIDIHLTDIREQLSIPLKDIESAGFLMSEFEERERIYEEDMFLHIDTVANPEHIERNGELIAAQLTIRYDTRETK